MKPERPLTVNKIACKVDKKWSGTDLIESCHKHQTGKGHLQDNTKIKTAQVNSQGNSFFPAMFIYLLLLRNVSNLKCLYV